MAHEYDEEARSAYDKHINEFSTAAASSNGEPIAGPSNQEQEEYDVETVEKVYR